MKDEAAWPVGKDRLGWVILAFGLLMYAGLGTVLVVFAASR